MTVAIAANAAVIVEGAEVTISVTGATASTDYIISLTSDTGSRRTDRKVRTNGSGAVSTTFPVNDHMGDTITASLRPATEFAGTTTAAATTTFTKSIRP